MAEDNKLLIEIEASTVNAVKALNNLDASLKDFGKSGTVSINQLELALSEIKRAASEATDINEIKRLGTEYKKVEASLIQAQNAFNGVADSAKRSRVAVYGLNQVVRDLPFGFIAISNNIPVLTDQLQELYRVNNNKLIPTLKAFGSGLVGAAGIGIAISAVTSLITYAIQEYGSLGNAIDALFGEYTDLNKKLKEATEELEKFNKEAKSGSEISARAKAEVSGDIQFYQNLANTVLDVNAGYTKQNSALELLKKSNKDFFGDINNLSEAQKILGERLYDYTKLAESEAGVTAIKKELTGTNQLIFAQEELLRQQKERIAELEKLPKLITGAGREIEVPELVKLREEADVTRNAITDLYKTWTGYNKTLEEETNDLTDANKNLLIILDEQQKAQKEKQAQQKIKSFVLEREIDLLEESLKYIGLQSDEYAKVNIQIIKAQGELKKLGETDPRIRAQIDIDTNLAIGKFFKQLDEDLYNEYKKTVKKFQDKVSATQILIDAKPVLKKDKRLEDINADLEKALGEIKPSFNLNFADTSLKEFTDKGKDRLKEIDDISNGIANSIGNIFGKFIDDIGDGKSIIQSLTDSFKDLAKQLAIAAVKYAIFNAVKNAAVAAGGAGKAGPILQILSFAFAGQAQTAKATGLPIGSGGLALSGDVTFVQRGPDLVGVLQRANNRINRVG